MTLQEFYSTVYKMREQQKKFDRSHNGLYLKNIAVYGIIIDSYLKEHMEKNNDDLPQLFDNNFTY